MSTSVSGVSKKSDVVRGVLCYGDCYVVMCRASIGGVVYGSCGGGG